MGKKRNTRATDSEHLRLAAQAQLAKRAREERPLEAHEQARLRHELEIHQVELEMQNEHLLRVQQELEAGLDRYTQLFDFAPIGYATLNRDGVVREVNHVGASMLKELRRAVIGKPFVMFV